MSSAATRDLHGCHIALVSIFYPPDTTGISPYAGSLASFLRDAGARVTVITGVPHYPQWRVDPSYRFTLRTRERIDDVDALRLRHFVPKRHSAIGRVVYEGSFFANGAMLRFRDVPDLFLAMTPSLAGAAFAMRHARRSSRPLGVIVQDLMGAAAVESGIGAGRLVSSAAQQLERLVLTRAQRVGVISEGFRRAALDMGVRDERIDVIPNWVHVSLGSKNRAERRRELGWEPNRRVVLHSGNMGFKQELETVVDAARAAATTHRDMLFVLLGDGNQRVALEARARGLHNLTFLKPVSDQDYMDTLVAADALLLNERGTVREMALPSKLTSYFASGRPVVAAVHAMGATAREIERSSAGLLVEPSNAVELLTALDCVTRDKEYAERLGRAGRAHARDHLSSDAARGRLLKFVTALTAPTDAARL